jgi:hypothetical protein
LKGIIQGLWLHGSLMGESTLFGRDYQEKMKIAFSVWRIRELAGWTVIALRSGIPLFVMLSEAEALS